MAGISSGNLSLQNGSQAAGGITENESNSRIEALAGYGADYGSKEARQALAIADAGGGGGGGGGGGLTQMQAQAAFTAALQSQFQVELSEIILTDSTGTDYIRRGVRDEETGLIAYSNLDLQGNPFGPIGSSVTSQTSIKNAVQNLQSATVSLSQNGTAISNRRNFQNIAEDGTQAITYDLNFSKGEWISFISENGSGLALPFSYDVLPSGTSVSLGTVEVFNDNGALITTDTFLADGQRQWIRSGGVAETLTLTIPDSTAPGTTVDFTIATHLTPTFDEGIWVTNAVNSVNNAVISTSAPVLVASVTNPAAIAVGASATFSGPSFGNFGNLIELSFGANLPTGANFCVEYQNAGVVTEFKMMSWYNPARANDARYTVSYTETLLARVQENNAGSNTPTYRVTNLGSVALPANILNFRNYTRMTNVVNPVGNISYRVTATAAAGLVTPLVFNLPRQLQFQIPKRLEVSAIRSAAGVLDTQTLNLATTNSFEANTGSPSNIVVKAGNAFLNTTELVSDFLIFDDPILSPLVAVQFLRTHVAVAHTVSLIIEY